MSINKEQKTRNAWQGIRFLSPHLKKHKGLFLIISISMAVVAISSALSAYIFKYILNDIFISKDEQMLIVLPLVVITLFMIRGLARFTSSYLTTKIGLSVANHLRGLMFSRLIEADYAISKKFTTGDINALIIQTALNIQNIISKTIPQLLISSMTVVALVILILYTDWRLSLYAITIGILITVPVKMLGKGVKRHTSKSEAMIDKLSNKINETFNNLDLIKVYTKESYEESLFADFLNKYEEFQIKLAKYQLLSSPFMEFFVAFAIAVVIFMGGHYVIDGSMSAGDFFAFMVALMMLYAPIKNLTQNYIALYVLNGYVQRVEQILDITPEQHSSKRNDIERIGSIEFEDIDYMIGDTSILNGISFRIEDGDRLAIVGKSGAGKSSIISMLFGLATPSSGAIRINDKPLKNYSLREFRKQISYVNQNASVFNDTIRENILYGNPMNEARYDMAISNAQCDFIYDMQNTDMELAGEFGNRLSGGQRQRLALARAIYSDGSLFVLDEATSALDANTESMIQKSLTEAINGKTSIIIAHRLSTIEQCNKVIVVEAGQITAYGSYDEVSKQDAFKRNFMVEARA